MTDQRRLPAGALARSSQGLRGGSWPAEPSDLTRIDTQRAKFFGQPCGTGFGLGGLALRFGGLASSFDSLALRALEPFIQFDE